MKRPSTIVIALTGSLLMWAAQPPLALGWLGWVAPVPWLWLVREPELAGRRPYRTLWFAAFVFWMAALHWLRLPHPAVYLGWFALSAYLAMYLPLFVGLSRVAVHRLEAAALARRADRLDRPRACPGPRDDRLHDGLARPHASALAARDSNQRPGRRIRRRLRDDRSSPRASHASFSRPRQPIAIAARHPHPRRHTRSTAARGLATPPLRPTTKRDPSASPSSKATASPTGSPTPPSSSRSWASTSSSRSRRSPRRRADDNRPIDLVVWPETMFRSPLGEIRSGNQAAG